MLGPYAGALPCTGAKESHDYHVSDIYLSYTVKTFATILYRVYNIVAFYTLITNWMSWHLIILSLLNISFAIVIFIRHNERLIFSRLLFLLSVLLLFFLSLLNFNQKKFYITFTTIDRTCCKSPFNCQSFQWHNTLYTKSLSEITNNMYRFYTLVIIIVINYYFTVRFR